MSCRRSRLLGRAATTRARVAGLIFGYATSGASCSSSPPLGCSGIGPFASSPSLRRRRSPHRARCAACAGSARGFAARSQAAGRAPPRSRVRAGPLRSAMRRPRGRARSASRAPRPGRARRRRPLAPPRQEADPYPIRLPRGPGGPAYGRGGSGPRAGFERPPEARSSAAPARGRSGAMP